MKRLRDRSYRTLESVRDLLDARAAAGRLRQCHGDLHLRNICLLEAKPVLFDGIEFNDDISEIDVLYDLSFLLMDLEHRRHRNRANEVFNRYFGVTDAVSGLAAMPLFLSCRAAIRAHTTRAAALAQADLRNAAALNDEALEYLDLAAAFLAPAAPRLLAIGGLSGSGKSTAARLLAPEIGRAPGALVLRSDVIRKRLAGQAPETPLPPSAYGEAESKKVYERMLTDAATALQSGQSVVLDAVFAKSEERSAVDAVARAAGVPVEGFWLDAPQVILARRVAERQGDASDATAEVVRRQSGYDLGPLSWRRINAAADITRPMAEIRSALRLRSPNSSTSG